MRKNNPLLVALILAAVSFIAAIAYLYVTRTTVPKPVSFLDNAVISEGGTPSGWQTYRNDEYGVEFEYPANWRIDGAEIHDPDSDAYIAISRLSNPSHLPLDDWWQANMIIGGRPTALYASDDININGVKAKILYQPEGTGGWHLHIADGRNNIISLYSSGSVADNEFFGHVLATFKFIKEET